MNLEIGPAPGLVRGDGWKTLDAMPGVCDFTATWGEEPLPLPDASCQLVFASHVLEHIPWWKVSQALEEVYRILEPGGVFEVWVPNFRTILDAYDRGVILDDGWRPQNPEADPWKALNGRLLWGARKGEEGQIQHFHKSLFDPESLESQLHEAGFFEIEEADRREGEGHGWMEVGRLAEKP